MGYVGGHNARGHVWSRAALYSLAYCRLKQKGGHGSSRKQRGAFRAQDLMNRFRTISSPLQKETKEAVEMFRKNSAVVRVIISSLEMINENTGCIFF